MLSELLLTEISRLKDSASLPLHRQLYEALRRAILEGKLEPDERLPSSRDLVQDLNLSRNTVVAALNQLTVEGYLVSRVGSGTFVSAKVPQRPQPSSRTPSHPAHHLSRRGVRLSTQFCASALEIQPFTPGVADFSAFPVALWQRLQNKHWRMTYPEMLDYSSSGGYAPLRRAVADYLRVFRSVPLDVEQVIITSGTQESLELCAQLLADFGDTVWLEDPAYWGAGKAFLATGLTLHPVPVDDQGMAPQPIDAASPPRLIYVTPSHQYPTGAVMSLARRNQLLTLANQHQAWVLEDDYDSEFRFSGPPIASLAGLDTQGRVLYLGSFSKVLYPGLKLGYMVVPKGLADAFKRAHYDLNRPGQMPVQAALAEFIEMGHFAAALRKARQSYAQRRHSLLAALQPCLGVQASSLPDLRHRSVLEERRSQIRPQRGQFSPDLQPHSPAMGQKDGVLEERRSQKRIAAVELQPMPPQVRQAASISGAEQGLHLCLRLPNTLDDRALALRLGALGLTVRPLSAYCLQRDDMRGLIIGYGYAPLAEIKRYGAVLAQTLQQVLATLPDG